MPVFYLNGSNHGLYSEFPWSWHNSFIAQNARLYNKLQAVYDSARGKEWLIQHFQSTDADSLLNHRFLIKSGKWKICETAIEQTTLRQATSCWQSAEWGIRAVQGSFPWLTDKLLYTDSVEACLVLSHTIAMLLNFRTHCVGLNQLSSTYYPMYNVAGDEVLDILY